MANRTSALVIATALVMLVASSSLRSDQAYAHGSDDESIAQIYAIKADAWAAIDSHVGDTAAGFSAATTEEEAVALRDNAYRTVEDLYWDGDSDMWWVYHGAHWADPVEAAYWDARDSLEERARGAIAEITTLYDGWMAENSGPTTEEVIARIDQKLQNGLNKIAGIIDDYGSELADAETESEAREERNEAADALAERVATTTRRLGNQLELLPDDPAVRDAHDAAIQQLTIVADAAGVSIDDMFNDWVAAQSSTSTTTVPSTTTTTTTAPPPTTTTTAPPPTTTTTSTTTTTVPPTTTTTSTTTTTVPPATTTTTMPPPPPTTTTTTLAPAALLPPTEPPARQVGFMTELPPPVVLSATAASQAITDDSHIATVGFVRRVVDSQLPSGVSLVAAGPLVVLGLIIDAIRAAGALMAVPWLVLGIYMAGLLRNRHRAVEAIG